MLTGKDPADRRGARRRQHPQPAGDLPDRRPRDDQRPAVVRHPPAAAPPRGAAAGRSRRWTACWASDAPRFEQLPRLRYLDQILRETLRLYPTAPAFAVHARQDTALAGRYPMARGRSRWCCCRSLHRDPAVWPDPGAVRPGPLRRGGAGEHPAPGLAALRQRGAGLPGAGLRHAGGDAGAGDDAPALLPLGARALRPRDQGDADPQAPGARPAGARAPAGGAGAEPPLEPARPTVRGGSPPPGSAGAARPRGRAHATPLLVLYGSNSGASEAFARRIASDGAARGYAVEVATLDDRAGRLPTAGRHGDRHRLVQRRAARQRPAASAAGWRGAAAAARWPACATRSSAAATATGARPTSASPP